MLHTLAVWLAFLPLCGTIFSDVGGFLSGRFSNIKDAIGAVWKAIRHVLSFVVNIFHHVGAAWGDFHHALRVLISGLEHLAEGTYGTLKYITGTLIPRVVKKGASGVYKLAVGKAKELIRTLKSAVGKSVTWLKTRINRVLGRLNDVRRFLTSRVNRALDWITKRGNAVWRLVSSPVRLVKHILPELVTPLAKWILNHIAALATLILRWFFANVGRFASEIERALARIF